MALDIDTVARRIDCVPVARIAERHRNTVLGEIDSETCGQYSKAVEPIFFREERAKW